VASSRVNQARQAAARDLLAPVYGWFAEEFDTAALKAAKALLDELRLNSVTQPKFRRESQLRRQLNDRFNPEHMITGINREGQERGMQTSSRSLR
jgi:hypothetical protein